MANCRKDTKGYQNKLEYIDRYRKETHKTKMFSFNTKNPLEVKMMEYLDSKESKNAFIKELIYQHMVNEGIIMQA